MKLRKYKSTEFLCDQYDVESTNEYIYMFSFLLANSDSFDESTKVGMQIFLSDLRDFRTILESELNEEEDGL